MNYKSLILAILAVSLISLTALGYSAPGTQKLSTTAAITNQDNGAIQSGNVNVNEVPAGIQAKTIPCYSCSIRPTLR